MRAWDFCFAKNKGEIFKVRESNSFQNQIHGYMNPGGTRIMVKTIAPLYLWLRLECLFCLKGFFCQSDFYLEFHMG